ncbi:MAG: type II toxin-antitoxin system RelB family antitoxin [Betaproteobacteria bacterium]|jgi:RHH-type rel operon transcriptional repressor/antitoxin RelB
MLAVRLEKQLETAIARIAEATGSTKSSVVREAVVRYLEDREDTVLAERARAAGGRAKSIAEVRKSLGLDG